MNRAGARAAALADDETAIRDAALAAGPGLDPGAVGIQVTRTGSRGLPVTVAVRYVSIERLPLVEWLFPGPINMTSSVTARQEFG